jgi:hypothetical protein
MIGYPSDRLLEEVAYIAYYFHWPYDQIMGLEHRERQQWVTQIAEINQRFNQASAQRSSDPWH